MYGVSDERVVREILWIHLQVLGGDTQDPFLELHCHVFSQLRGPKPSCKSICVANRYFKNPQADVKGENKTTAWSGVKRDQAVAAILAPCARFLPSEGLFWPFT
jgi:hypothetical protein